MVLSGRIAVKRGESVVRIAHLSDLHITDEYSENALLAKRALECDEVKEADLVVITGDLTEDGLPREFKAVRHVLSGIQKMPPLLILPGNHDSGLTARNLHQADIEEARDWCLRLAREFGECEWFGLRDTPWPCKVEIGKGRCCVFGIDSNCLETDHFFSARGKIGPEQLAALENKVDSKSDENRCVLALHHHPLELPLGRQLLQLFMGDENLGLVDREDFTDLITRKKPSLVVHGHKHFFLRRFFGKTAVVAANSTTKGCSLSGGRFIPVETIGLETGVVEVSRVHYANAARIRSMADVFTAKDQMKEWQKLVESVYDSEDLFIAFARAFSERTHRLATMDMVSGKLDHGLIDLLDRTGRTPETKRPQEEDDFPLIQMLLRCKTMIDKGEDPFTV